MKALICNAWGKPDTLVIGEMPARAPDAGELRIRVRACGINFADTLMIQGQYQFKPPFPFSPGIEMAGDVLEVGADVKLYKPGMRVMCIANCGAMAEEITLPATMAVPMPDNMDYITGAAFPVAYGTSHIALQHRAHVQPGETLLVLGAAGGVGLTAVEIGKRMGARVIACASTEEKLELTRQYGADYTINYTSEDLRERLKAITGGKGVDVAYDPVGGPLFEPVLRSMAWEGRLLVVGFASGNIPQIATNLPLVKNCAVVGVFWGAYALNNPKVLTDSLRTLLGWYSLGHLKPHISQTYTLEQAPEAMWALMRRQSLGKVVVTL